MNQYDEPEDDVAYTKAARGQVYQEVDSLREVVEQLEKHFSILKDKLIPILHDGEPSEAKDTAEQDRRVPLASAIHEPVGSLWELNVRFESLISRITL